VFKKIYLGTLLAKNAGIALSSILNDIGEVFIYVYVYICIYKCVFICIYINIYMCVYEYIYICVYMYICICICIEFHITRYRGGNRQMNI
jgi:hypothetical protein